jgi:hypothetical protein
MKKDYLVYRGNGTRRTHEERQAEHEERHAKQEGMRAVWRKALERESHRQKKP